MTWWGKQMIFAAVAAISAAGIAQTSPALVGQTVRGALEKITPQALEVRTSTGVVHVAILAPLTVYSRRPADLSQVKDSTFVGITSVKQPDGSQVATEVHIFPEALRGTGEGSYMMSESSGNSTTNRMTNGSVAAPLMTNGTAKTRRGGRTVTVDYGAGSQVIAIPPDVQVTAIVPIEVRLTPGERVVVLATKAEGGSLVTGKVLLLAPSTPRR